MKALYETPNYIKNSLSLQTSTILSLQMKDAHFFHLAILMEWLSVDEKEQASANIKLTCKCQNIMIKTIMSIKSEKSII
jgi:hypothetical protein